MFEYYETKGVDYKNIIKHNSVGMFDNYREQSKRHFSSLEKTINRNSIQCVEHIFNVMSQNDTVPKSNSVS